MSFQYIYFMKKKKKTFLQKDQQIKKIGVFLCKYIHLL